MQGSRQRHAFTSTLQSAVVYLPGLRRHTPRRNALLVTVYTLSTVFLVSLV